MKFRILVIATMFSATLMPAFAPESNDNGVDGLGWAKLEIEIIGVQRETSFSDANIRIAYKGLEFHWLPEPTSFTLIGLGALAFGLIRPRRG